MKKIAAVLLVMTMAGCSGMGMHHSGRSGASDTGSGMGMGMGMGMGGNMGPSVNQSPVINPDGSLNLYHGG